MNVGLGRMVNWDTRTLLPGNAINTLSKPWDNITAEAARHYPPWYRALVILSTATAGMPINLQRVDNEDGGKKLTPGTDHPAFWPICVQANEEETAAAARARMVWIAAQFGASYAGILRQSGKPIQIIPFSPYQCWPERIDGQKWYIVNPEGVRGRQEYDPTRMRKLLPEDVIECSMPSDDGMYPDEPYWIGRMTLHEGVSGSRVRSARAANSGRPRVALTTPQSMNEATIKRIREEFPAIHSGLDDRVVPAILEKDLKPIAIPYQPEYEAESVLNGITLRMVSNLTGVPATFLGDNEGRSYNSLENDIIILYEFGLGPWLNVLEDQYRAKLLTPNERRNKSTEIGFDRQTTKFADTKSMAELIRVLGAGAPIAKINEIRAKFGWSALEDEEAKKLYFPKNMGQGGSDNQPGPNSDRQAGGQAVFQKTLENMGNKLHNNYDISQNGVAAAKLIAKKIAVRMGKEAGKKAAADSMFMNFASEIETTYHSSVYADFEALAQEGGIWAGRDPDASCRWFLQECRESLLEMAGAAKKGELSTVVDQKVPAFVAGIPDRFIDHLRGGK